MKITTWWEIPGRLHCRKNLRRLLKSDASFPRLYSLGRLWLVLKIHQAPFCARVFLRRRVFTITRRVASGQWRAKVNFSALGNNQQHNTPASFNWILWKKKKRPNICLCASFFHLRMWIYCENIWHCCDNIGWASDVFRTDLFFQGFLLYLLTICSPINNFFSSFFPITTINDLFIIIVGGAWGPILPTQSHHLNTNEFLGEENHFEFT